MRRRFRNRGFTRIELLVVILIIAILAAVAIATFLGQTGKAQSSAAQQSLAVTYADAKADWISGVASAGPQSYGTSSTALSSLLSQSEPQYTYLSGTTAPSTSGAAALDANATLSGLVVTSTSVTLNGSGDVITTLPVGELRRRVGHRSVRR